FGAFTCRLVARVVARRDARVRDQQHGRAVRGQHPLGEKKVFFGDFLSPDKKLPAPWSGSSGSKKKLDSSFRWNDERREKSWIPAFAGMTSEGWGATLTPTPSRQRRKRQQKT